MRTVIVSSDWASAGTSTSNPRPPAAGLTTARILPHASHVYAGYVALWERKQLDLTVEALILNEEWNPLFSNQERGIARKGLTEYGYNFGPPAAGLPQL
jgi:hypothetical protein